MFNHTLVMSVVYCDPFWSKNAHERRDSRRRHLRDPWIQTSKHHNPAVFRTVYRSGREEGETPFVKPLSNWFLFGREHWPSDIRHIGPSANGPLTLFVPGPGAAIATSPHLHQEPRYVRSNNNRCTDRCLDDNVSALSAPSTLSPRTSPSPGSPHHSAIY